MLRCKQVTTMVGRDEFANAGPWLRAKIRLHLMLCRHCRRYVAQIRELGTRVRERFRDENGQYDSEELQRSILDAASRIGSDRDSS